MNRLKIGVIFSIMLTFMASFHSLKVLGNTLVSTNVNVAAYGDLASPYLDKNAEKKATSVKVENTNDNFVNSVIPLISLIVSLFILAYIIIRSELEKRKL